MSIDSSLGATDTSVPEVPHKPPEPKWHLLGAVLGATALGIVLWMTVKALVHR
jgi:hypothetical protein